MEHFQVLGCLPTATMNEATKAYKDRAKIEHPDRGGDTNRFQQLSTSFEQVKKIITDPMSKHLINNIKTNQKGKDITVNCFITLEEYFQGTHLSLNFVRKRINLINSRRCSVCMGTGVIISNTQCVNICGVCQGVGMFDYLTDSNASLNLDLPPFFNQDKLFFERDGHQCYNGEPGNLIVNVNIKNDPLFMIKDYDLHTKLNVKLADALIGYSKLIYHPNGDTIMYSADKIIKPKEKIIFENKGIKKNDGSYGNFIVHVNIIFPDKITEEGKELIRRAI